MCPICPISAPKIKSPCEIVIYRELLKTGAKIGHIYTFLTSG